MGQPSKFHLREERFHRLLDDRRRMFMVPMDHGASMGPAPGVESVRDALQPLADLATCTTVHKGYVAEARAAAPDLGLLMHLSVSTDQAPDPNDKRIIGTVEEALALGADGVSVHVNVGSLTEADQLEAVGRVSTDCNLLGVPLIAMMYPRGPNIANPFDTELVAHAARLGRELGADAVKVPFTNDPDGFRHVVQGAGIPVIVAGGPVMSNNDEFLALMRAAAAAGASGISVGRNVFQAPNPRDALSNIIACFP